MPMEFGFEIKFKKWINKQVPIHFKPSFT